MGLWCNLVNIGPWGGSDRGSKKVKEKIQKITLPLMKVLAAPLLIFLFGFFGSINLRNLFLQSLFNGTVDFLSDNYLVKSLTFLTVPIQRKLFILIIKKQNLV